MYRKPIGTYNKKLINFLKPIAKFIFRLFRKRLIVITRGRGKRAELAKRLKSQGLYNYGLYLNFSQDLPIKYASKVAVYLTTKKV